MDRKFDRLLGSDPGGLVTSSKKEVETGASGAEAVAVSVSVKFWVTGAVDEAVKSTVNAWPGMIVAGDTVAVTPGGNELRTAEI